MTPAIVFGLIFTVSLVGSLLINQLIDDVAEYRRIMQHKRAMQQDRAPGVAAPARTVSPNYS